MKTICPGRRRGWPLPCPVLGRFQHERPGTASEPARSLLFLNRRHHSNSGFHPGDPVTSRRVLERAAGAASATDQSSFADTAAWPLRSDRAIAVWLSSSRSLSTVCGFMGTAHSILAVSRGVGFNQRVLSPMISAESVEESEIFRGNHLKGCR